jgi:hypothetical protein
MAAFQESQPRADYLELLKLTILFLGGQFDDGEVSFAQPGPVNNARWMSVALYSLRLALFRKQLQLTRQQSDAILQVAIFVVRVYVQAWFVAPLAVSAPRNDLALLQKLVAYSKVNKRIAAVAQTRLVYHLWYLSEIMMGITVFDEGLSVTEREKVVTNMRSQHGAEDPARKREGLQLSNVPKMSVGDLVTTHSMQFFRVLDLQSDFLDHPVSEWASRNDYREGREIVTHLRVVNDIAERGVKLFKDYNRTLTKKEHSYQNLCVSVQAHRKARPDFNKNTLISTYGRK